MSHTETKICTDCGEPKGFSEFSKRGTGLQPKCKPCSKAYGKRYYKYNAHKDWVRKLWKRYKLTEEGYITLFTEQDSSCAICGKHQDTLGKRLAVDHCHDTNMVRGLLCDACNKGIGLLGDKAEGVLKAYKYLEGR